MSRPNILFVFAEAFYRRMGYREVGRKRDGDAQMGVISMRKTLSER